MEASKIGLGLFEKSSNAQNLYENQVIETFPENSVKNIWSIGTILFLKKMNFISKITKLSFVNETIKSTST